MEAGSHVLASMPRSGGSRHNLGRRADERVRPISSGPTAILILMHVRVGQDSISLTALDLSVSDSKGQVRLVQLRYLHCSRVVPSHWS